MTMNQKRKINIAFLGGDRRQLCTASMLKSDSYNIGVWGVGDIGHIVGCDNISTYDDCDMLVGESECVIFPLPSTTDGVTLNTPLLNSARRKKLCDVLKNLDEGSKIIGGKIPQDFKALAAEQGVEVFDYYESEPFQIENAYLTAEAALSIAMNQLNNCIRDSTFAILGYGRIAKQLARLLRGFGADVTVFARNEGELSWARSIGCKTRKNDMSKNNALTHKLTGFDVIYNTIPVRILDGDILKEIGNKTFIIDLASLPGGVDICAAKEQGNNVLWATSLPGKYAPESAGRLIADWIENVLSEERQ